MKEIIAEARALGKKIAVHPRMRCFVAAARAVAEDGEAQDILNKYQQHIDKIRTLEMEGKPIEADDKHAMADYEVQVASNDRLKEMMKCQADYLEMMKRINDAIDEAASESNRSDQQRKGSSAC